MIRVGWHSAASLEVEEAAAFSEAQRGGRGERLLEAIGAALLLIRTRPMAGTEIEPGVRKVVLHRFPYSIIYELSGKDVYILSLAHDRREPGYWSGRVSGRA